MENEELEQTQESGGSPLNAGVDSQIDHLIKQARHLNYLQRFFENMATDIWCRIDSLRAGETPALPKNTFKPIAWACWIDDADPSCDAPQLCVDEPRAYKQRQPLYVLPPNANVKGASND